ncbi:protein-disulfide reductase DsbD domain-containing protein [Thalassococcus sp. BH17M4-6]|uniref:protein-disulfide reductase DsbD domain-containing protein n=1 Tax=Thalassococcus sp. BH17M4-6 TaxID=3413148 RepID=UPI003BE7F0E2
MTRIFLTLLALIGGLSAPVLAQSDDSILRAELRPGWRLADGDHMAALHLTMAPGWKTYWRAPGDAGIPPLFDWSGSRNAKTVAVSWPTPEVFFQSGMRSVGYSPEVVLPLRISTRGSGQDVRLRGQVQLGVCKDICVPKTLRLDAVLPAAQTKVDPVIAAALASVPFSATEAAVRSVRCTIGAKDGAMTLRAEIDMPARGAMDAVIETANPEVWVAEPKTTQSGGRIVAETRMMHVDGGAFALDRSGVRITLLGKGQAVDIRGCDK